MSVCLCVSACLCVCLRACVRVSVSIALTYKGRSAGEALSECTDEAKPALQRLAGLRAWFLGQRGQEATAQDLKVLTQVPIMSSVRYQERVGDEACGICSVCWNEACRAECLGPDEVCVCVSCN